MYILFAVNNSKLQRYSIIIQIILNFHIYIYLKFIIEFLFYFITLNNIYINLNHIYFILFYFILFYFILFYFILFYFILFYSLLNVK